MGNIALKDETVLAAASEMEITQVEAQVQKLQQLMVKIMKAGEHYGIVPGTEKNTLYLSGAQKLGFMFRLRPQYPILEETPVPGHGLHRQYNVVCRLYHIGTSQEIGEGVGNCSTMETKYRYRNEWASTGRPVPKKYWEERDKSLLGGKGFGVTKVDGKFYISQSAGKVENPDVADEWNTCLKMAKKRAYVDAMITACAASDIFTQDLEDRAPEEQEPEKELHPEAQKKAEPAQTTEPAKAKNGSSSISHKLVTTMVTILSGRRGDGSPVFTDDEKQEFKAAVSQPGVTQSKLEAMYVSYVDVDEKRRSSGYVSREEVEEMAKKFDGVPFGEKTKPEASKQDIKEEPIDENFDPLPNDETHRESPAGNEPGEDLY